MPDPCDKQPLVILGAGSFAEEVADLVSDTAEYEPVAFIEGTDRHKCGRQLAGLPVVWIDDAGSFAGRCRTVCAVGTPQRERFIGQAQVHGLQFATVIHPTAHISSSASLGAGTIVGAGSVIAAHTTLARHVIVNRGCLVGHHVAIGDFTTLSPGANIAGRVTIGRSCYVGMGAIVLDGLSIGSGAVVGAGSVVTREIPEWVQVVGIPARIVKELHPL